jgi:DNA polymerase-3 subunit alpha
LVVWALGITDIDPIRFGLMFERFLNPARVSMPDIDTDFSQDRREEVVRHVRERYGDAYVGQIANINTFATKASVKDAGRIVGLMFDEQGDITKGMEGADSIEKGLKLSAEGIRERVKHDPTWRIVVEIAKRLERWPVKDEGRPRHPGVHAAGVVIASRVLGETIGMFFEPDAGQPICGIEMNGAEDLGLVKFDFLGLKTLDVLHYACNLVEERTGTRPNLQEIPFHDEDVLKTIQQGDVLGMFQIESDGMKRLVESLKPTSLDDLTALLALYRPGPLNSGMVADFVERKHGRTKVELLHPKLEKALEATYGVIVYQEQVMAIAQVLAGFSLADADLLRRAMGKKKPEEMAKQKKNFVEGAIKNGVLEADAVHVFELVDFFSGYGFNKSHSAAYALITWQTAWLKTKHRAEFLAAAMSWEKSASEEISNFVVDARRAGVPIMGPDIVDSRTRFDVITKDDVPTVRFGLQSLKGVGDAAMVSLLEERKRRGPFLSLDDFLTRRDARVVNKRVVDALADAGAFDRWKEKRWTPGEKIESGRKIKRTAKPRKKKLVLVPEDTGPRSLEDAAEENKKKKMPPPWPFLELMRREKKILGTWVTAHPLDRFLDVGSFLPSARARDIPGLRLNEPVTMAALVTHVHRKMSRDGLVTAFVQFSDPTGTFEAICFDDVRAAHEKELESGEALLIRGIKEKFGSIRVEELVLLREIREKIAASVVVGIDAESMGRVEGLVEILDKHPGKVPLKLRAIVEDKNVGMIDGGVMVRPSDEFFNAIELWAERHDRARILPRSQR